MSELQPYTIDQFWGVNKSVTETQLKLGEASNSVNWMITDDQKLKKMFGYSHLFDSLGAHKINGEWWGSIGGTNHHIFACNGHVYKHNDTTHVNTDLGTLADAYPTTIFSNNNTIYILNGTEFYKWAGTGSISVVTGYTPIVATATPPSGGGTLLEAINYINGQKIQRFSADGTATVYQILETSITSFDQVKVNGVVKTLTTDYTVNLTNGTVTFVSAPLTGVNNVEITWTKTDAASRALITNCKQYGGIYYSRLWLYGNPNYKNTRFPSGITIVGVSDPEYWPMYSDSNVGEYEITGIVTQYDKQMIYTSGGSSEASAWYSTSETITDPSSGIITILFPVYPVNAKIGNTASGQVQVVVNNPITICKGVYEWSSITGVVDEKNATWISQKIQDDLDGLDLASALTIDWNEKGLYLLCAGNKVWVLNYRVRAWYVLQFPHTPTCFCVVDGNLCFGTSSGQIMQFDEEAMTYDGTTISAVWESGFMNFGVEWLSKFIQRLFTSLKPELKSRVDITYETDKGNESDTYTAEYHLIDFDDVDFDDFTFDCSYNPQPFKFKIRAKKIDYFKLILTNDQDDYGAIVLSITIPTRTGGEIKGR